MKKGSLLLLLCLTPLLCGCTPLYAERREVEQLRIVQTMGLDPSPGGVCLTLATASGVGQGNEPLCYSATGSSISDAMERLRDRSLEETLFCGHLQHILIGEAAARNGIDGFLAYVCRSSDARLDMPMFLVLDTTAQEAMTAAGSEQKGIAEALESAREKASEQRLSTAGAILRDLERQNAGVIRALMLQEASEEGEEPTQTVVPDGFGVLVGGKYREHIGPEDALAVELLTDSLSPCPLVVYDREGRAVTLEVQDGSAALQPMWDEDGSLRGLDIAVQIRATVQEIDGFDTVADDAYTDALTARLETAVSQRLGNVLRLSRTMEADFLGLGSRLEQLAPYRGRGLGEGLGPLLPELELSLSVRGELSHSNDIN